MNSDLALQFSISLIFIVIGMQLIRGKWLMLIAGYNTMSSEKRKRINGQALGKALGIFLLYFAVVILATTSLPALADLFGWLILVPIGFLLIYVNTSAKFKN
ncbi:DUF3784 domain-containing protein [Enterococcus sp. CWB-B31]|uniref:DUF3784 domain-containing protein n=1 Tax=Enterococcus sp. CWB-B31 TaxID=2885159 RepID=UPI001E48BEFC|nr:DUF3784 domain-containing protein [Enterococcus sp. CWB-B31]MCB5955988.1 DUF3784 domain-containing protein [Enterococcus sp. CWB-B31]